MFSKHNLKRLNDTCAFLRNISNFLRTTYETHRCMFKQLKGSWFGQILRLNSTSNNLERNLIPVANKNKINVTEKNKMRCLIRSFTSA